MNVRWRTSLSEARFFSKISLACAVVIGFSQQARATVINFGGFADGVSVSVSFTGSDLNSDGIFSNYTTDSNEISGITVSFSGGSIVPDFTADASGFIIYVEQPGLVANFNGLPVSRTGEAVVDISGNYEPDSTVLGNFALVGGDCASFGGNRILLENGICAQLTYTPYTSGSPDTAVVETVLPEPISLAVFGSALFGIALVRRRASVG